MQVGEATQKLKEELSEVETKYQHLKAEFKQLQQQREEKDQHGLQLQSEINQVRAVTFIYCTSSYGFFFVFDHNIVHLKIVI